MSLLALTSLILLSADGGQTLPQGWFLSGNGAQLFQTQPVPQTECGGRGVTLASAQANSERFATVMQIFGADAYRGKRVRLSATLSAKKVTGWAGLWMRVDGTSAQHPLAFDNMQDRPIRGDARCRDASVVLDVPEEAKAIALGVILSGPGTVELSALDFRAVDLTVAPTNILATRGEGVRKKTLPNLAETDEPTGRINETWHTEATIRSAQFVMGKKNPTRWADFDEDHFLQTNGDVTDVKLGRMSGTFTTEVDAETTRFVGRWGGYWKETAEIEISPKAIELKWGAQRLSLVRVASARTQPNCARYYRKTDSDIEPGKFDLELCGDVLDAPFPTQGLPGLLVNTPLGRSQGWSTRDPGSEFPRCVPSGPFGCSYDN